MSELYLVVGLQAKKGKEDQLKQDLIAVVEPSRRDFGNLRYELYVDDADPGQFVFVEHWVSAEAQEAHHTQSAHIQQFHLSGAANVEKTTFLHRLSRIA
ncbi:MULTISPECIES: putative quinol monooxygenase [unclassified Bradyrhizobium]|uniref:putative quinol monooxygenase n=1 Tax=unclassified Bradyrhizobium TaxID=2631580 RepID=UPI002479945B|nr:MULTISPECIES: putative quinol monooxygenase [unclassified Bradyrhizobium]WGR73184.1 antibiotic biosynthesis monooxygenase [Bradyrhizobium sp. ISRA426]WGR78023.1 antibiotic biosynthesis monooxygenase [Bradyrhizobium sp. ISRA430]WGR88424.1 antibiotic biosynthesis monooxygenase [Bradyrhizobium sp. ISRA432]